MLQLRHGRSVSRQAADLPSSRGPGLEAEAQVERERVGRIRRRRRDDPTQRDQARAGECIAQE